MELIWIGTSVIALSAMSGCGQQGLQPDTLVITGSSTMAPFVQEIGHRFEDLYPDVRVDVQTGGSTRGIADARTGLANIGMTSRSLNGEEKDLYGVEIARDGICIILNNTIPVRELHPNQIRQIYRGEVTDWSDVDARASGPITVVSKAAGRSTLDLFLHHFGLRAEEIYASVIIGDNEQGIKTVAGNPHAIGYVSIGTAEYAVTHGTPIKLLPLDGITASVESVRAGRFPLSRPLTLVMLNQPTGLAGEFIRFATSSEVHDVIKEHYFVPLQ